MHYPGNSVLEFSRKNYKKIFKILKNFEGLMFGVCRTLTFFVDQLESRKIAHSIGLDESFKISPYLLKSVQPFRN